MKVILVDDEVWMLKRFEAECEGIEEVSLVGRFTDGMEALEYVRRNPVEAAFLDIAMPDVDGITLAQEMKKHNPGMVIMYVSAHVNHMPAAFQSLTADYFICKPYRKADIKVAIDKAVLLSVRMQKRIYIRCFGRFTVQVDGKPVVIGGKAKEILALVVTRRGKEISNEEIYSTVWENRAYSHENMVVFHNALRRLRAALEKAGISELLISNYRAQMVNTGLFDCDYYRWRDKNGGKYEAFEGEFLSEYTWGEYILADLVRDGDGA